MSPLDQRFGRAAGFLVYDDVAGSLDYVSNEQNLNAAQGAGIQAATTIAKLGVDCVITGHCGPKAFQVLSAAGVKVYNCSAATVAEAYELLKSGSLVPATGANAEAHWS